MHVRTSGAAADARVTDDLAALNARARHRREGRKMRIPGADAETMIEHHQAPIAGVVFRDGHDAVRRRVNRRAVIGRHVNAGVECAFTAERIQAVRRSCP